MTPSPQTSLTPENYSAGFLIDEELLAGVSVDTEQPGKFLAYVVRHTTGEPLGAHRYPSLDEALAAINRIPRTWAFEKSGGCGGGKCGEGACGQGQCKQGACATGACPTTEAEAKT